MTTASTLPAQSSDTSMIAGHGPFEWFHRQQPPQWEGWEHSLDSLATSYQPLSLRLELRRDTSSGTESRSVRVEISAFTRWVADLQKLQRQHRERQAAVYLDATARRLLEALDRRTSIRWEDLPDVVQAAEWRDVLRSVALLAGANLCEAGPTRIRLSEHGDKLLAESASADQVNSEVERRSIR